nr:MAG TPA: hypothetical protein [Bacteriophage sp.]
MFIFSIYLYVTRTRLYCIYFLLQFVYSSLY